MCIGTGSEEKGCAGYERGHTSLSSSPSRSRSDPSLPPTSTKLSGKSSTDESIFLLLLQLLLPPQLEVALFGSFQEVSPMAVIECPILAVGGTPSTLTCPNLIQSGDHM